MFLQRDKRNVVLLYLFLTIVNNKLQFVCLFCSEKLFWITNNGDRKSHLNKLNLICVSKYNNVAIVQHQAAGLYYYEI